MVIKIAVGKEDAEIRPAKFLGEHFGSYLTVMRTMSRTFDRDRKLHLAAAPDVPMISTALKEKGFIVEVTEKIPVVLRPAKDDAERNAAAGLIKLASLDPDHARYNNGVGFSGHDSEFGHSLAAVAKKGLATDKQWEFITKLAHKYRRQLA